MASRDEYLRELRGRLAQWDAELAELRARRRPTGDVQRADFERQMELLAMRRRALEQQIRDLEQRPESGWQDFKDAVERAWGELGRALDDTVGKYGP